MKSYKKLAVIIPVAALSTSVLFSPVMTFAAEKPENKVIQKTNNIQGYLIKNGVKTPVYQQHAMPKGANSSQIGPVSPEFPILPENPLEGIPQSGKSVTELGDIGDIVYFDKNMESDDEYDGSKPGHLPNGKVGKKYLQKTSAGVISGFYDPETFELYPFSNLTALVKMFPDSPEWNPVKEVYQKFIDIFDGTTKLKRETQYSLIDSSLVDSTATYKFNQSVKHGVSTGNIFGFAATVGIKINLKAGLIPTVLELSSELSESLTTTYQHSIIVTDETTNTQEFSVGKVDNPSYKYNKYAGAAYQLNSTYSVVPGNGLKKLQAANPDYKLANSVYNYKDNQLYFTVTPGSHVQ
ncbi:hypothetical protein [Bacillus thuringiensis]|uniref:hypothetical protein n=1 Tax=Bacillus thuringiensis TaxID=1428 RepID=UPI000F8A087C|nr:hypothetical protein [Bacillus thuringiensis]AZR80449.1 hypothetical protein BtSCAC15_30145 [Bacillus thuringiensis]AZR80544.1 hypothetical protein BtSCAC15_30735 [Bacillus thuringiensis]